MEQIEKLGQIYEGLIATRKKRKSGAHYTPIELAKDVVKKALESFLKSDPTPAQILKYRVVDPAMGGGVFLLEVCRQLSETLLIAMDGEGDKEAELLSRRLVLKHCLFGVDRDRLAVEASKISLCLFCDASDLYDSLDKCLKCGDSLFIDWKVSFSDVFPGGFDCVIGNPPFLGGKKISGLYGDGYLSMLKERFSEFHGNADLCAAFLRLGSEISCGVIGFVCTNTISQGDTRRSGLKVLIRDDWCIYHAVKDMPWPGEAAVTVSIIHLIKDSGLFDTYNSRLLLSPERPDPVALEDNLGKSYIGSIVLGKGFTLTPDQREELVRRNARNAERIFPYLGGREVNTSPTQSFHRYVINFCQMSLDEAGAWPDLIRIVREQVKPERDKNKREVRRKHWWRFGEVAPALYEAIRPLERCLVTVIISKHLMFSFQPANRIFSHKLYVFPLDQYAHFALLQSRIHVPWAWLLSSTMKTDLNYSASDCFETFPFPKESDLSPDGSLEAIGQQLYDARAAYMEDPDVWVGLTTTYNRLKDPENDEPRIVELRQLHEEMDRAVLRAYGWEDIEVPPYCPHTDTDHKALKAFKDEVIDRLFVLNGKRVKNICFPNF